MPDKSELEILADRIDALEKRPKDGWDKAGVIVAAFVPVTIAILSAVVARQGNNIAEGQLNLAAKQTESQNRFTASQLTLAQKAHDAQIQAAKVAADVEKAKLVREYIDMLVDRNDPLRVTLAKRGIMLGIPQEGEDLVNRLSQANSGTTELAAEVRQRFPIVLGKDREIACRHRGGTTGCVVAPGIIQTPPPDGGLGIFQATIPAGARRLTGLLTEFSGTSCNGGAAIATIRVDGETKWTREQHQTTNQPVDVALPPGARILELRVDSADGTPFCDDPEWRDMVFNTGS